MSSLRCRVLTEQKNYYALLLPDGREALGVIRKRLLKGGRLSLPVVGDWVLAELPEGEGRLSIESVEPRQSLLTRREAGRSAREQPFAANVDLVLVVAGLDQDVNLQRLERTCAIASRCGAKALVLLNKADLAPDAALIQAQAKAGLPGHEVLLLSAATGLGVEALAARALPGQTLVLIGPSGVGKSSLANLLSVGARQATAAVREGDAKGRHTTTYRRLVPLPGGAFLIDSPGVRELGVVGDEAIKDSFDDIKALAQGCRFRDCCHGQEPGCAVRSAVDEGRLDAQRHAHYLKLRDEAQGQQARALENSRQAKRAPKPQTGRRP